MSIIRLFNLALCTTQCTHHNGSVNILRDRHEAHTQATTHTVHPKENRVRGNPTCFHAPTHKLREKRATINYTPQAGHNNRFPGDSRTD